MFDSILHYQLDLETFLLDSFKSLGVSMELFRVSVSYWTNWIVPQGIVPFHLNFLTCRIVWSILLFLISAGSVLTSHFIPGFGSRSTIFIFVSVLRHSLGSLINLKNWHFISLISICVLNFTGFFLGSLLCLLLWLYFSSVFLGDCWIFFLF